MTGTHSAAGAGPVAIHKTAASAAPKVEGIVTTEAQIAAHRESARAEGREEGLAAGRAAERERMSAILDCDEAKGRDALARHFAFESEMTADVARAALAKSPKAEDPKSGAKTPNRFDAAMTAAGNPAVGLELSVSGQDDAAAFADAYFAAKHQKRSA